MTEGRKEARTRDRQEGKGKKRPVASEPVKWGIDLK